MSRRSDPQQIRQLSRKLGTPSMQKVIFLFLKKLPLDPLPSKKKRRFSIQMVFFVLMFAGISQTATYWSSSVLQDLGSTIPSADSVLDVVESISEELGCHRFAKTSENNKVSFINDKQKVYSS